MTGNGELGGQFSGIYARPSFSSDGVFLGVYVGESRDCFLRNRPLLDVGFCEWAIVREMPQSTRSQRVVAEVEYADSLASRGWAIPSKNTSAHLDFFGRRRTPSGNWRSQ